VEKEALGSAKVGPQCRGMSGVVVRGDRSSSITPVPGRREKHIEFTK